MPVFFQQQINPNTRLGVWKIEESESFFKCNVPVHQDVSHPHKRLQHLAGRFLLQFLFPDFPYELIQVADTRKPFLPDEQYHFSISHCGDLAAAIVSRSQRVGIDVELVKPVAVKLIPKFLSDYEKSFIDDENILKQSILFWSAKESVYKWYGYGAINFRQDIQLLKVREEVGMIDCFCAKNETPLTICYKWFNACVLTWVVS